VFESVVVVAFQIALRAEIHANDIFLFFKNHFLLNFSTKKKLKI
jgi:hypothetical protein